MASNTGAGKGMISNADMKAGRFAKLANGRRKMARLNEWWDAGATVYIHTYRRVLEIEPKNRHRLKMGKSGSIYIARGESWDCVDFCKITALL